MDVELKGKTALVFAGSQGLGKAIAARLAEEGANVMIASRSEEKLAQVAEEISYLGSGQVVLYRRLGYQWKDYIRLREDRG